MTVILCDTVVGDLTFPYFPLSSAMLTELKRFPFSYNPSSDSLAWILHFRIFAVVEAHLLYVSDIVAIDL